MTDYIEEMMRTAGVKAWLIFTPKKQLEIIKLISRNQDDNYYHSVEIYQNNVTRSYYIARVDNIGSPDKYAGGINFEQALAQLTTELMMAGELDIKKVKEVLE